MSSFPTVFSEHLKPIDPQTLDTPGQEALKSLETKGYEVLVGLTPMYAEMVKQMSLEPSIRAYCPKDCAKRFADLPSTEAWLLKGRSAMLLFKKHDNGSEELAGYGWSGLETNEHTPGGETTFALRVSESNQGQGLASPYAQVILSATRSLYGAEKFWLETWASNAGAVHVYEKLGFQLVDQVDSQRPLPDGSETPDRRLYMVLSD
jgi:ribosomal protein S18 acetylase RimI-like enzyme